MAQISREMYLKSVNFKKVPSLSALSGYEVALDADYMVRGDLFQIS